MNVTLVLGNTVNFEKRYIKTMSYPDYIARFSHWSFRFILRAYNFFHAVLTGFWLGVMGEKSLDAADEFYYNKKKIYTDVDYNTSGLFGWEDKLVKKHFPKSSKLLLIAAGGGREVLALKKMGYEVDSFECNPKLIEFGNTLLENHGFKNKIKFLERNAVPSEQKIYDGVIIGWGAFSLIRGKRKRKAFLTDLRSFLKENAPLMVSFLTRCRDSNQDKIIVKVSNVFRGFRKINKTEIGDRLENNFVHYFSKTEIIMDLLGCNYKIVEYNDQEYGCAIIKT